jgi:hypothetical protein
MAIIRKIKKDGIVIYPRTVTDAVVYNIGEGEILTSVVTKSLNRIGDNEEAISGILPRLDELETPISNEEIQVLLNIFD